jgi:hypothetical protein
MSPERFRYSSKTSCPLRSADQRNGFLFAPHDNITEVVPVSAGDRGRGPSDFALLKRVPSSAAGQRRYVLSLREAWEAQSVRRKRLATHVQ